MNANDIKTIERIRSRYDQKEGDKLTELKALDKKSKRPATVFSYLFGSAASLVLGTGMCIAMEVILPGMMLYGVLIGLAGIALASLTYPIHKAMLKAGRRRYAARVIELSDSLLGGH